MGDVKWLSGVGIAQSDSATDPIAAPVIYPVCESAQIVAAPTFYERQVAFLADIDHIAHVGYDYTFTIDGITPHPYVFGYLWWLALGGDTWQAGSSDHLIEPADDIQFFNLFIDYQNDVDSGGGTNEVGRLLGCKITNLTIEQATKDMAKMSISGVGCSFDTIASITPSVPTGATNEPLGWKHLSAADAWEYDVDEAGTWGDDDSIEAFKIEYSRNPILSGVSIGSNQPTDIKSGIRNVMYEFTKEWTDAQEMEEFWSDSDYGIRASYTVSTNYGTIEIPKASFVANVLPEVGQAEEILKMTVSGKATKGTGEIITVTSKDGTVAAYT